MVNKTHLNEQEGVSSPLPEIKPLAWVTNKMPKRYKPQKKSFPFLITKRCNMICDFCVWRNYPKWNSKDIDVSPDFFEEVIVKMKKEHFNRCALVGGEVALHPQFQELINTLVKHKIKFTFVTNARQWEKYKFLLEEPYTKYFSSMAFSLDGKPETHDKYRGKGSYKKVIEAMDYFFGKKQFSIKMVLRKDNFQDVAHVFKIFQKYYKKAKTKKPNFEAFACEVSDNFVLMQPNCEYLIEFVKKLEKKNYNFNKNGKKVVSFKVFFDVSKGVKFCPALDDKELFILTNGDVGFCCGSLTPVKKLGDIKQLSVKELLKEKCKVSLFLINKIFPLIHSETPITMKDPCALCRHVTGCSK